MKLNNKGFVASTLMYSLLVLFLFLILGLIALLSNRKMILDKLKNDIKEEVNSTKKYTYYENGTPIYFNPVTNKICGDYTEKNSLNGVKTGCLKWYIFNDDINRSSVTMILDHNIGNNVSFSDANNEITSLINTSKWNKDINPRLISVNEINKIVGISNWDKSWYYFETKTHEEPTNYTTKYNLLNNNLVTCQAYGCETASTYETYGYWTSTEPESTPNNEYTVSRTGIGVNTKTDSNIIGVRPVISVDKKEFKKSFVTTYDYTGDFQTFVAPVSGNYKIELWGAQGGNGVVNENYGGKGAYTSGTLDLSNNKKIYVYIGGFPNSADINGYNGGTASNSDSRYGSGGGATDIRLISGDWDNSTGLASRIMVAAGGGGGYSSTYSDTNLTGGYGGSLQGGIGNLQDASSEMTAAGGGKQTSGGTAGIGLHTVGNPGLFGKGGTGSAYTASGGGGYYGGGSSGVNTDRAGSGAGGSSFISGHVGCVAIASQNSLEPRNDLSGNKCTENTTDITCSYHYSNFKFISTNIISGNQSMPTHDGKSTMTGNTGNGYAKITYLGN